LGLAPVLHPEAVVEVEMAAVEVVLVMTQNNLLSCRHYGQDIAMSKVHFR
jgi:hypothetical protein